jgi:hypothetical protein
VSLVFPPGSSYLPPGLHRATVDEVGATLVDGFPSSTTRREIFDGWTDLRATMSTVVSLREQWLDGSYVTTKEDPGDADLVVHLNGDEIEALDSIAEATLKGLVAGAGSRAAWRCDSYPLVEYPSGHPLRALYEESRSYWRTFFGHDRSGVPKGIVEVAP